MFDSSSPLPIGVGGSFTVSEGTLWQVMAGAPGDRILFSADPPIPDKMLGYFYAEFYTSYDPEGWDFGAFLGLLDGLPATVLIPQTGYVALSLTYSLADMPLTIAVTERPADDHSDIVAGATDLAAGTPLTGVIEVITTATCSGSRRGPMSCCATATAGPGSGSGNCAMTARRSLPISDNFCA